MAELIRNAVELTALGLAAIAVLVLIGAVFRAVRYALGARGRTDTAYDEHRVGPGKPLLLGLELLAIAGIIRTAALESTLQNVAVLGFLVLVRTFLRWPLIEGHWPWRTTATAGEPATRAARATRR